MTRRRSQLQVDTHFLGCVLQDTSKVTQREIAEKLCISTSGLKCRLKALMDKGLVKFNNFSLSKNEVGYIYVLTTQGIAEKTLPVGRFLKRKMTEYDQRQAEIEAFKAGMAFSDADGRKIQNAFELKDIKRKK